MATIGFLYPGHAAEDDYPRFERMLGGAHRLVVEHTYGEDLHAVDVLLDLGSEDKLAEGAGRIARYRPDAVLWACTSGSFVFGWDGATDQADKLAKAAGVPASSTSFAFVHAAHALGIRRVRIFPFAARCRHLFGRRTRQRDIQGSECLRPVPDLPVADADDRADDAGHQAFDLMVMVALLGGLLLSFSRGAWVHFAVSASCLLYDPPRGHARTAHALAHGFARHRRHGRNGGAGGRLSVDQFHPSGLVERAKVIQPYDVGPGGRFTEQKLALSVILDHRECSPPRPRRRSRRPSTRARRRRSRLPRAARRRSRRRSAPGAGHRAGGRRRRARRRRRGGAWLERPRGSAHRRVRAAAGDLL